MSEQNANGSRIIVDRVLCEKCSIANDNWGRQGVTPFAVACYIYHAINTLGKTPAEAMHAVMTKWDSLYWGNSGISISIWNKLFNGSALTEAEWEKILFPLVFIDTIYTNVTSSNSKCYCHPMFFGPNQTCSDLLICTSEAYQKAIVGKKSAKVTAYRYGLATQLGDIFQGLREETWRVVFPV